MDAALHSHYSFLPSPKVEPENWRGRLMLSRTRGATRRLSEKRLLLSRVTTIYTEKREKRGLTVSV